MAKLHYTTCSKLVALGATLCIEDFKTKLSKLLNLIDLGDLNDTLKTTTTKAKNETKSVGLSGSKGSSVKGGVGGGPEGGGSAGVVVSGGAGQVGHGARADVKGKPTTGRQERMPIKPSKKAQKRKK